jgi:tetratricopeptide (TPR) repeat protein
LNAAAASAYTDILNSPWGVAMRRWILAVLLAGIALAASAVPSVDDVQTQVAKGNYARAEELMREVIAAKPGSARAHYIYAEILAHNRRFAQASEQLTAAKAIDPQIRFTQPETFRSFEQTLAREQASERRPAVREAVRASPTVAAPTAEHSGGVPGWVWGVGAAAVALVAWRAFSSRRSSALATPYGGMTHPATAMGAGAAAGGYGPVYPPAPAAGSGLLGTGLAVAGGVAAGMLAEKLLTEHNSASSAGGISGAVPGDLGDGGDVAAARELEDRPVDFGSGDDWDGGGSAGGSSDGGWD